MKEKKVKRRIVIILNVVVSMLLFGSEFKEITPLENKFVVEKDEIKAEEKKEIELEKVEDVKDKIRIEDLSVKRVGNDGKIYVGDEKIPYTGELALFLGDIIEYTETYVDGVLEGPKIWYSYNGNVVLEESYKDNKVEGEQRAYYEDGKLKSIVVYKNDKIISLESFAKDGKVLYKSDLSKGTGIWKYFWENGQILEEGKYKNWKKDGVWVKYRENGEVDVTTTYNNGKLISQVWG